MGRRYIYQRMTAEQLSTAMDELGLSKWQLIRLTGSSERKVDAWLDGKEDIPHWVLVLCSVLTVPGAMEIAKRVTDHVVSKAQSPTND